MLAWQHAQPIGFGPVADLGLAPQIEFWPDKHGTAGRQFSQAMASRDACAARRRRSCPARASG